MSITLKTIDFNYDSTNGGNISQLADSLEVNQEDGVFQNAKIALILTGPKYMADTYYDRAQNWTLATKLAEKVARQDVYTYLAVQTGYPNGVARWDYDDGTMGPPLHLVTMTAQGNTSWKADCTFEWPQYTEDDGGSVVDEDINNDSYVEPSVEDDQFEYSSSGETAHIIQSIATIGTWSPQSWTATDYNGMIGWNGNEFEGVDVIRPAIKFSFTVNRPYTYMNSAKRLLYASMVGGTNISPAFGFPAGCVLFENFAATKAYVTAENDGVQEKQVYWRCTYSFSAMPATTIGTGTGAITKAGYDYVWQHKQTSTDSEGNETAIVDGIYVEQVYPRVDFANFDLILPY